MKVFVHILLVAFIAIFASCDCRYGCENGVCQKRVCKCDLYWEGDACQRPILSRYQGSYNGTNSCDSEQSDFTLKSGESVDELLWNNELTLTFSDTARFDILQQDYRGISLEGEGSMLLDKISFRYHSIDTSLSVDCLVTANLKLD